LYRDSLIRFSSSSF